jgi:hypothetical protein
VVWLKFLCLPYASRLLEMFVNNSAAGSARGAVVFRDCQFSRNFAPCWLSCFPANSGNQGKGLADSVAADPLSDGMTKFPSILFHHLTEFFVIWLKFVVFLSSPNYWKCLWTIQHRVLPEVLLFSAIVIFPGLVSWIFLHGTSFLDDFRVFQIIPGSKKIG